MNSYSINCNNKKLWGFSVLTFMGFQLPIMLKGKIGTSIVLLRLTRMSTNTKVRSSVYEHIHNNTTVQHNPT